MTLQGSKTEQNLLNAFAGESQARNRYEFYSKVAKKEGYEQIGAFFLQTAENERSHAKQFYRFLEESEVQLTATWPTGKIGTTAQNLLTASLGEHEEWTTLYPGFSETALAEGFRNIAGVFKVIATIEELHEKRFRKLLENIETGQVFARNEPVQWECRVCGYVHTGLHALEVCPACQHPKAYFELLAKNY